MQPDEIRIKQIGNKNKEVIMKPIDWKEITPEKL
jgi:hypothetical protein